MKKKIIIGLTVFSIIFLLTAVYTIIAIERSTAKMDGLSTLHQVEILREQLLIQVKRVQSGLFVKGTRHAGSMDTVTTDVQAISDIVNTCFGCHHAEQVAIRLHSLKDRIEAYKSRLSRVFTVRAEEERLRAEEAHAFRLGAELIAELDAISTRADLNLKQRTRAGLGEIQRTKSLLYLLVAIVPFAALGLSIFFINSFTRPLNELLTATRRLKSGDLSYRIDGLRDEFGEVASSFNDMAAALREGQFRMQWAEQLVVLGEMVGGLAHEIKNPLAGIKASVDVLSMDRSLSNENRVLAFKVAEQIRRIDGLIKSVLNFARPPKPHLLRVDINHVIDSTVALVERHPAFTARGQNKIIIRKALYPQLPETMADPQQLQQVFFNLLLNSADAMREGGAITMETSRSEKGESVEIRITDAGNGIDEAITGKIFLPFFTTKPDGTGLGLAISKGLVEQHGGSISVTNNRGRGVTFTITVPVRTAEEETA